MKSKTFPESLLGIAYLPWRTVRCGGHVYDRPCGLYQSWNYNPGSNPDAHRDAAGGHGLYLHDGVCLLVWWVDEMRSAQRDSVNANRFLLYGPYPDKDTAARKVADLKKLPRYANSDLVL